MNRLAAGPHVLGDLAQGATREWLVTDGLGGYAMGTASGLRTRRYHGLLVTATAPPIGRQLGLASLDATLVVGDQRVPLAVHEWASGAIAPRGHELASHFDLADGVPRWRWTVGDVVVQRELAMLHGRNAVGARWTVLHAGADERVGLEVEALCTWRDVHGERRGGPDPAMEVTADGFVFENAYRVRGAGFVPGGSWYRDVRHREEQARGLTPDEDLWSAGRFVGALAAGESCGIVAWSGDLGAAPPPADAIVSSARSRARILAGGAADEAGAVLARAADQFVVATPSGPTVVAGYPWFGDWSRDTMTSYEGLFLETGRFDEGRDLLLAAAASISEGMLANTADAGGTEYNTADGSLWFLYAIGRHVARSGDLELAAKLASPMIDIVDHHLAGTRFGIRADDDALITQGADGWALTWMDARVDGVPVTQRRGKPVEINALWIAGLRALSELCGRLGGDGWRFKTLAEAAETSFLRRFVRPDGRGLYDVVDGPGGGDASVRPNQLIAAALAGGPAVDPVPILAAVAPLVTPLGLRSLDPRDPGYLPEHRGGPAERDRAYHMGTVWPWLIGPWAAASARAGRVGWEESLAGLHDHLGEWGLGSVSETADGDAPHAATGCPFQAWSVAELIRARNLAGAGSADRPDQGAARSSSNT